MSSTQSRPLTRRGVHRRPREAGTSSLLGHLAAKGVGIVVDDAVVDDEDGFVLAGPRCVDLHEGAADWLGQGKDIGMVGARRRWCMHCLPFQRPCRCGVGSRQSGRTASSWRLGVVLQPRLLYANRYLAQFPRRPRRVLDLIPLPIAIFRPSRRWESAEEATAALLDRVDG